MANFHAPAKVLNLIDTRPKDHEVKGAVQVDQDLLCAVSNTREPQSTASFPFSTYATFNKQDGSLAEFITLLRKQLNIPRNDEEYEYALRFEDRKFVTELNKCQIQQGFILCLSFSPGHYSRVILSELTEETDHHVAKSKLSFLNKNLNDVAFVEAFVTLGGAERLMYLLENDVFETHLSIVYQILTSLTLIMVNQELMVWKKISEKFILKIASFLNGGSKSESNDSLILTLEIILAILNNGIHSGIVKSTISFEALIRHLENSNDKILLGVLRLMNNLYAISSNEERSAIIKTMHSAPFFGAIENLFQREIRMSNQKIRDELGGLCRISLDEMRVLAHRSPSNEEIEYVVKMSEFRRASPGSSEPDKGESLHEGGDLERFRALILQAPPGTLALIAICTYMQDQTAMFSQVEGENFLRPSLWPFIMAQLSSSLMTLIGISAAGRTSKQDFNQNSATTQVSLQNNFKLILRYERPFHRLFSLMVDLFNRSWREMHAGEDDLAKVITVVGTQFERALNTDPGSIEELNQTLQTRFTYFHIRKLWEEEGIENEDLKSKSTIFQSLKQRLRQSIEQMVLKRKRNFLKAGATFVRIDLEKLQSHSLKDHNFPRQFWKLEENERFISFCESSSSSSFAPADSNSWNKMPIGCVQSIVSPPELASHLAQNLDIKISKKMHSFLWSGLCLVMGSGSNDNILLSAIEDTDPEGWRIGLNALCFPQTVLSMPLIKNEVDRILITEVKISMLDLHIVDSDLQVPSLPTDFSWLPAEFRPVNTAAS